MRGETIFSKGMESHLFRGWGIKDNKHLKFGDMHYIVMEICSLKNYVFKKDGVELILHIGYEDNIQRKIIKRLEGVELHIENESTIRKNLSTIEDMLGSSKIVIVSHNTLPKIRSRSFLLCVLSDYCKESNIKFVDPTVIIDKYGMEKCLPRLELSYDFNHYTDFMKSKVREKIMSIIES